MKPVTKLKPNNRVGVCSLKDHSSLFEFLKLLTGQGCNFINKFKKCLPLKSSIKYAQEIDLPVDLINHGIINHEYTGPSIDQIFENHLFLVLNKPCKTDCHPLRYSDKNTCLNYLRNYNSSILNVNSDNYDRGLLYRLDHETSGVLIYVKQRQLHAKLRENFHQYVLGKYYLAIVENKLEGEGVLKDHLVSYGPNKAKMKVIDSTNFNAELYWKVLDYNEFENVTFVLIKLQHGLRHQIRVQLANQGSPILGDPLYGDYFRKNSRMFLHAWQYHIKENHEILKFKVPIPDSFRSFFDLDSALKVICDKLGSG